MDDFEFKEMYEDATHVARTRHGNQKWGVYPYMVHLYLVHQELKGFTDITKERHQNLQIAAWLHDLVEDTELSVKWIKSRFTADIALLVDYVTDPSEGNRRYRKLITYKRILEHPEAIILKAADLIVNIRGDGLFPSSLLAMYWREWDLIEPMLEAGAAHDTRIAFMGDKIKKMLGVR